MTACKKYCILEKVYIKNTTKKEAKEVTEIKSILEKYKGSYVGLMFYPEHIVNIERGLLQEVGDDCFSVILRHEEISFKVYYRINDVSNVLVPTEY